MHSPGRRQAGVEQGSVGVDGLVAFHFDTAFMLQTLKDTLVVSLQSRLKREGFLNALREGTATMFEEIGMVDEESTPVVRSDGGALLREVVRTIRSVAHRRGVLCLRPGFGEGPRRAFPKKRREKR